MEEPTKADIDAIFKRLKTLPANKACFDCDAKNPTWASVTYGVFLCIDCSARHRGLGVHLSFIRSTNLDTTWGWLQLRAMQVGGNANALFLDESHKTEHSHSVSEKKEGDFFHEHSQASNKAMWDDNVISSQSNNQNSDKLEQQTEGPSVDQNALSNDGSTKTLDPKKSTIGQRRAPQSKKKGFGAQKVTTDFKEVERNVQELEKMREQQVHLDTKTREETEKQLEKQMAGLKFVYQDLSTQRDVAEEKMKRSNPQKAEQMERLGMGFGNRSGVSHSAMTDMQTIQQEGVTTTRNISLATKPKDFFDDFNTSGFSRSKLSKGDYDPYDEDSRKLDDDLFKPKTASKNTDTFSADWEIIDRKTPTKDFGSNETNNNTFSSNYGSSTSNSGGYNSSSKKPTSYASASSDGDAQKRFSNAKAISSDQFFNKDSDSDRNNVTSRFQGNTSISSEDYFGDPNKKSQDRSNYHGPDMATMKADFKEGVSKAAGRLSSLANSVMSSIQDRCNFFNRFNKQSTCIIEPDPRQPQSYSILLRNSQTNKTSVFARLSYKLTGYSDYLYTIIIGQKLYQIRSCDLKYRRLTIMDETQSNESSAACCPQILFQVLDSFSKSNDKYHLIINDKKYEYGYIGIVILLYLHEYQRNIS
ncbi:unnamed protein product [Rotaria magnacalcarata]|uniref:Arf-GAP domain-containing protein n=1 Tax=Rotaria magnacalcarata TaxID=392030 RepID=A0A819DVN2_9BILA|nr:unnamed protein product [Rotaria magnacalcarata]